MMFENFLDRSVTGKSPGAERDAIICAIAGKLKPNQTLESLSHFNLQNVHHATETYNACEKLYNNNLKMLSNV